MLTQTIVTAEPLARTNKEVKTLKILETKEEVKQALALNKQLYLVQTRIKTPVGYFHIRQNGKLREWVRNPERWELPCKYGLKECFTLTNGDTLTGIGMLAIDFD